MKLVGLLLLGSVLIYSCQKSETPQTDAPEPVIHIKTAPVTRMDVVDTIKIYGQVKLRQEAQLASQFDGRLTDFNLLLGDAVIKGQKIGQVIPAQREALLQVMNRIDANLRPMLEQQIKSIPLTSPIDGVVLDVQHHSGDVLQKGEPIVQIGDLLHLDVYGDLPVGYIPVLKKLKKIQVSFMNYPHPPLWLKIEAIGGSVAEAKQTVPVRLGLDNPDAAFRPGMLVQLRFPGKIHQAALVIPRESLLEEEGIYSVFVLKDQRVEKRTIVPGIMLDGMIEVLSGLQDGEQLAAQKAYSLTDGVKVVVE